MLEVKFMGKEPEVILGCFKSNEAGAICQVKGDNFDILTALVTLVATLKQNIPGKLVDIALKFDATEYLSGGTVIDMDALKEQLGK